MGDPQLRRKKRSRPFKGSPCASSADLPRCTGRGGAAFKGTDIVDGAELLWDPLVLDAVFTVTERHADEVEEGHQRSRDREAILRNLDLWAHIRATLTPRQYQILEHLLLHGYSVVQIADLLQVKQPVVSMLLRTALEKLRSTPLIKSLKHLF